MLPGFFVKFTIFKKVFSIFRCNCPDDLTWIPRCYSPDDLRWIPRCNPPLFCPISKVVLYLIHELISLSLFVYPRPSCRVGNTSSYLFFLHDPCKLAPNLFPYDRQFTVSRLGIYEKTSILFPIL